MSRLIFKRAIVVTIFVGLLISIRVLAAEQINNFTTEIKINQDASFDVKEVIEYDFGSEMRHGIYRDIPIKYQRDNDNYNIEISDILVTDSLGNSYQFSTSKSGGVLTIKIGDPNKIITGEHVYEIYYQVNWAINYFTDHDELYWNATGNEWDVPIDQSAAEVSFSFPVESAGLTKTCFQGPINSQQECLNSSVETAAGGFLKKISYQTDVLYPDEGLTIVVGFPKGLVYQPSQGELFLKKVQENLRYIFVILLPFIILIWLYRQWYLHGRDIGGRQTIIPQYDSPDNLTPSEIGTVVDERAENRDISADIINLAVKGYLKINKLPEQKDDYLLKKLKDGDDLKNEFEKKLLTSLFSGKQEVKISALKNKFYKDLNEIRKQIYEAVTVKGYFVKNPQTVRTIYIILGIIIIILGPMTAGFFNTIGLIGFIFSGSMFIIFSFLMPKRTLKGVLTKEYILGLKMYLSVAEKDRYKFHYAPAKNPEVFERLLPYAIALRVEKEWAKQFEDIYHAQPAWYSDPSATNFNSFVLISGLSNFTNTAKTAMAATPHSSAGGGGSGFGGGFSGGGFGGGGGGSW